MSPAHREKVEPTASATIKKILQKQAGTTELFNSNLLIHAGAEQGTATSGKAATVIIFGLPGDTDVHSFPAIDCMIKDLTIRYSWLAPDTWPDAVELLHSGKVQVGPVQSFNFALDDLADSIDKVHKREDNAIKPLMKTDI